MRRAALLLALLLAGTAAAQPTGPAPAFPHADGENCEVAGEFPKGVDEEGAVQDCTAAEGGGEFMPIGGGTFTGNVSFGDTIELIFGEGSDASIQWDTVNLVIDPYTVGGGYTDFTGAIFVAEGEDHYSRFGGAPTAGVGANTTDMLVARKLRTTNTGAKRAGLLLIDIQSSENSTTAQSFGGNFFVYTDENNANWTHTRTWSPTVHRAGAAAGGRYHFKHRGAGIYTMAGGASTECNISGGTESGEVIDCYGWLDEGSDGGDGAGGLTRYHGLWVKPSNGKVTTKYGGNIEDLTNATDSVGLRIAGAKDYGLWLSNAGTDTNDGIWFGGCVDLYDSGGPPQTTGLPDYLCDSDGSTPIIGTADINLYRAGADLLKTDDSLEVVGDIHGGRDTKCVRVDDGLTTGLLESIWYTRRAVTFVAIWCETDAGTVLLDLNIDDGGAPEGVNGSDITCDADGEDDAALAGDYTMGAGDTLDLDVGVVTTATRVTVCWDTRVD